MNHNSLDEKLIADMQVTGNHQYTYFFMSPVKITFLEEAKILNEDMKFIFRDIAQVEE